MPHAESVDGNIHRRKNGAKILRSLLKKSSGWAEDGTRLAAEQAASAAGLDRVVEALRHGRVSSLRKEGAHGSRRRGAQAPLSFTPSSIGSI